MKEWEAMPHEKLNIPEDITSKMSYKVIVYPPKEMPLTMLCERFITFEDRTVKLENVLIDTSQYHQGHLIKRRATLHKEVFLINIGAIAVPLEKKVESGEDKNDYR